MMWKGTLALAAALALGACGGGANEANAADPAATDAAGGDAAVAGAADGTDAAGDAAADAGKTDATEAAAQDAAAAPAAGGASGLMAYVGKWPFDEVNGVIFDNHPMVKAGVAATLTDAAVRKTIAETEGPASMIEMIDGKVSSWACQAHNCGFHQWMVMVDPKTGATDVCYYDEENAGTSARWFLAGGKQEKRAGNCTIE